MATEKSVSLKVWSILVMVSFLSMVVVNALANTLPLNNYTTGFLSNMLPNLFVPAGFTFSIWGVIYLLLGIYSVSTIVQAFSGNNKFGWSSRDGLLFVLNALLNSAWIFAWHWRVIWLSLVLMIAILITLILLNEALVQRMKTGPASAWFLVVPIQVYLGWICVALIANVTVYLVHIGWQRFGIPDEVWTIVVLVVGLLVGISLLWRSRAWPSALVIVWAYIGIVAKRFDLDGWSSIAVTALILAVVMAVLTPLVHCRKRLFGSKKTAKS